MAVVLMLGVGFVSAFASVSWLWFTMSWSFGSTFVVPYVAMIIVFVVTFLILFFILIAAVVVPLITLLFVSIVIFELLSDKKYVNKMNAIPVENSNLKELFISTNEIDEDSLELLRNRYARGDLTDDQFERKLEQLLETETNKTTEDHY